jgi:hypothetical protein
MEKVFSLLAKYLKLRILLNLFSAVFFLSFFSRRKIRYESLLCALQSMKNQCLYCKLYLNRLNCINVDGFLVEVEGKAAGIGANEIESSVKQVKEV